VLGATRRLAPRRGPTHTLSNDPRSSCSGTFRIRFDRKNRAYPVISDFSDSRSPDRNGVVPGQIALTCIFIENTRQPSPEKRAENLQRERCDPVDSYVSF
jgi:hypothetical protein